ncbi:MAG TPA: hypothetical protein VMU22_08780 [Rhizomicrobium sp.]|nr:hypothetical protein [Rhizomicrobium sp.]
MAKHGFAGILLALGLLTPSAAAAGPGWDCTFEGAGGDAAHYIAHLDLRGRKLIEPHWPASIAYRILVDTRDMLIAARAYEIAPTFRSNASGAATVLMINKRDGRLRRATTSMGGPDDRIETGTCARR